MLREALVSNVDLTLGGMEQKTLQGEGEERVEWMGMGGGEEGGVGLRRGDG